MKQKLTPACMFTLLLSWCAAPLTGAEAPGHRIKAFCIDFNWAPTIVGVRTANAKLVKYPGHAEWTEVFDLAVDPYELKNLAADTAATAKLSAEFDAQVKAVKYAVPPGADKPRPPAAKAKK